MHVSVNEVKKTNEVLKFHTEHKTISKSITVPQFSHDLSIKAYF